MKKYIFAVLLIILFSCKHTREIIKYDSTENLKTENKTETNQNVKTDSKINSENNSNKTEQKNSVIEETIVQLSIPDSTGEQHIETITNRKTSSGENISTITNDKKQEQNSSELKSNEKSEVKADGNINQTASEKTVQKSLPAKLVWIIIGIFTIFIGLLAFLKRKIILKKLRIFKN